MEFARKKGKDRNSNARQHYRNLSRNTGGLSFVLVAAGITSPFLLPYASGWGIILLGTGICLQMVSAGHEHEAEGTRGVRCRGVLDR